MATNMPQGLQRTLVDHIPIVWCEPTVESNRSLVIWLPGFSGTKESVATQLQDLAEAGFIALSFDPYQHGERKVETQEQLVQRIIGNIRRYFWPILTLTAEEFPRIIDWAIEHLHASGSIMAGGVSMGGDIAVAAGSVDQRIKAISACVATPDWMRPGSHEPPGAADTYAHQCFERRNPLSNVELYNHGPAISFQCGEGDTQVPPAGAERFMQITEQLYRDNPECIEVVKHPNTNHQFTAEMWENSLRWFLQHQG